MTAIDSTRVSARLGEIDLDIALAEHLVEYLETELDAAQRRLVDHQRLRARTLAAIEAVEAS